jgi:hypothetical protein
VERYRERNVEKRGRMSAKINQNRVMGYRNHKNRSSSVGGVGGNLKMIDSLKGRYILWNFTF